MDNTKILIAPSGTGFTRVVLKVHPLTKINPTSVKGEKWRVRWEYTAMAVASIYGCVLSHAEHLRDGDLRVYFDIEPTSSQDDVVLIVTSLVKIMNRGDGTLDDNRVKFELVNPTVDSMPIR